MVFDLDSRRTMKRTKNTFRRHGHKLHGRELIAAISAAGLALLMSACSSAPATPRPEADPTPAVETVKVVSRQLDVVVPLPAELQPYEAVAIYPKVTGFVKWIGVDRGSRVKRGQVLARLEAPEIVSQKAAAQSKLQNAENQRIEAEAKLAAAEGTYERLQVAARTPGVISDNELEIAQKTAEAARARSVGLRNSIEAARATLHSVEVMEGYLRIVAPFDGIITERGVHPGALVGPSSGAGGQGPMLRIEHISNLRLVVAVPEAYVAGVATGAKVSFNVPAYPNRSFSGTVARVADSLDATTRTMPVELDVANPDWLLHSGMFPTVSWPVHRPQPSLFVPQSAVLHSMQGTYVIRVRNGNTEWVNVKPGVTSGNAVETFGELHPNDEVVLRASEELAPGTRVVRRAGRWE